MLRIYPPWDTAEILEKLSPEKRAEYEKGREQGWRHSDEELAKAALYQAARQRLLTPEEMEIVLYYGDSLADHGMNEIYFQQFRMRACQCNRTGQDMAGVTFGS